MRYLYQFARIMVFCFLGEILHEVLPLPVPASIYGLVLLLAALKLGIVRLDQVKEVGNFLTGIFPLLFVPAAVGVMELWVQLGEMAIPILIAIIPVTVLVLASAGRTTQAFTGKRRAAAEAMCGCPDAGTITEQESGSAKEEANNVGNHQ